MKRTIKALRARKSKKSRNLDEYLEAVYNNNKKRIDKALDVTDVKGRIQESPLSKKDQFKTWVKDVLAEQQENYARGIRKTKPTALTALKTVERSYEFSTKEERLASYIEDRLFESNLTEKWNRLSKQGRDKMGHFTKKPYKLESFVMDDGRYVQYNANDNRVKLILEQTGDSLDPWRLYEERV